MESSLPSNLRFIYMTKINSNKFLVDFLTFKEKQLLIPYSQLISNLLESNSISLEQNSQFQEHDSLSLEQNAISFDSNEFLNSENLERVLDNAKLIILSLGRDNPPSHSLIIIMLLLLKDCIPITLMKYQTINDFLNIYNEFITRNDIEKNYLYQIANWMNILFRFIPAKVRFFLI